jgi:hypothetical protein
MQYNPTTTGLPEAVARELRIIAQLFAYIDNCPTRVLAVAPEKPRDGEGAICNGTTWNPIGDGVKRPVWYDATAATWKKWD